MSHISLPKFFLDTHHGNANPAEATPSVFKLLFLYVMPLSLLPPLMYVYSQIRHPGKILPLLEPALTTQEAILVGAAFFMVELLAVALMAMYIQQLGEEVNSHPSYAEAYALAAIAPTPLWIATLGLALPNVWINATFLIVAWFFCAGLIRRGVGELYRPYDDTQTHRLSNAIIFTGVASWFGLLLFLVLLLSMVLGWR